NVANAGARYAVNCNYWLGAQRPHVDTGATDTSTKSVINAMLVPMGVNSNQATVVVDQTNATGCAVTITITGFQMIPGLAGGGNLTVTASGVEPWLAQAPIAAEGLSFTQNAGSFYMPSYGAGAHTPGPSSGPDGYELLPYWENGAYNGLVPRVYGPYQNQI